MYTLLEMYKYVYTKPYNYFIVNPFADIYNGADVPEKTNEPKEPKEPKEHEIKTTTKIAKVQKEKSEKVQKVKKWINKQACLLRLLRI